MTTKGKIDLTKYTPTAWTIDKTIDTPLNKRTDYGDIESLAASIRKNGIECALLGRPSKDQPGMAEIVWGKRRRRAAQIAGVTVLPLVIRDMTDLEVLDAQFVENQDRKDFTPLEESTLYRTYRDEHRLGVETIAERVSRSESYVRRRVKLLDLIPAAQESLAKGADDEGGLELGAAEVLACYPPSVQDLALPHMRRTTTEPGMTGAQARVWLAQKFTLKLASPPFNPEDGTLVASAGKCSTCPKRTGNQAELFADLADDTCTDPTCYDAKATETWARRSADLEAKGYKVLPPDEAIEVFGGRPGGSSEWIAQQPVSQKFVALDERVMSNGEETTYRKLLGGKSALKGAQVLVARHPRTGAVFELLDAKEAATLAEKRVEAGKLPELPTKLEQHTDAAKERKREEKKREKDNRAALAYVIGYVVATIAKFKKLDENVARIIAHLVLAATGTDVQRYVADRRDIWTKEEETTAAEALEAHIEQLPAMACVALVWELVALRGIVGPHAPEVTRDSMIGQTVRALGLDLSAIIREGKVTTHGEDKPDVKAANRVGRGECRVCACTDRDPCGTTDDPCYWHEEPTKGKADGLCSSCGDPMADLLDVMRKLHGPVRLKQVLTSLAEEHRESADLLENETRREKVLKYMTDTGIIALTTVGARKEIYVQLERDPDEHETADEEES